MTAGAIGAASSLGDNSDVNAIKADERLCTGSATLLEPPTEPSSEQPELAEPWSEHLAEPAPASVQTEPAPAGVQTQPKKRVRPKGSKNKPCKKAGQEQLPEQPQQEPAELLTVT